MTESVNKCVSGKVSDWVNESACMSEWVRKLVTKWVSVWEVTKWLTDKMNEWVIKGICEWVNKWISDWISKWLRVSVWVSE